MMHRALIVVDVQKDFCEGGALAVDGGSRVAEKIANFVMEHEFLYSKILFTKDFHREDTDNGGHFSDTPDFVDSWPPHCIAYSAGSEFHPALSQLDIKDDEIFYKGYDKPDYSGFQGYNCNGDSLNRYLRQNMIDELHIVGIAGDYCVKATALDAVRLNYETTILPRLVASVRGIEGTFEAISEVCDLQLTLDTDMYR